MAKKFKQKEKRNDSGMNQRIDFTEWLKENPRMRPRRNSHK